MEVSYLSIGNTICEDEHDWEYTVSVFFYIMINRKCNDCKEEQETKAGLSDDDFEVISHS